MKKLKNYIKTVVASLLLLAVTSCQDYLDVNTDPNNPTQVPPSLILPVGQNYTANYLHTDRGLNHLGNLMMYNWSESYGYNWYTDEFLYQVTTTFYNQLFDWAYTRSLKQYNLLDQLGENYENYVAIGKIMKAYHFQILVDLYGDIPYSDALGRNQNATPKYDGASAVYNDLLGELTAAIELIKSAEENVATEKVGADDAMFAGDMTKWIQFANTLKVRMLTRLSGTELGTNNNSALITTELAAIAEEGSGFITSDVIINPGYIKEVNKQNPFWASFGKNVDDSETQNFKATAATQFILDYLASINDPRIDFQFERPATGHLGVNQGLDVGEEFGEKFVSNIGPGLLKSPTMGSPAFTLAEHNFNMAELALRGFGGDPEQYYYNGIRASFAYLGMSQANYDAYIATANQRVNYLQAGNKLEVIITQKWLAMNGITAEQSWFDYSRTGFPANLPISNEATTADRPVRLFYPASERSGNTVNVPAQPNAFTDKIFWAK